ncbi:unnamed protein product [Cyprideis torosa]|uniref:Uncharacterized protein n=1 Tax=Cyprideis torosa TaxID=163714 RepID=A0A7R8ZZH2_9CRUS|nr:unnamed protein product [Cyprideis torosa]CAG0909626.1 unnamed protein product [Cyprideis torosa]
MDVGLENCYLFLKYPWKSWNGARDFCDKLSPGAYLVEFDSEFEHYIVLRIAAGMYRAENPWIGAFFQCSGYTVKVKWLRSKNDLHLSDVDRRNIKKWMRSDFCYGSAVTLDPQLGFGIMERDRNNPAPFICEASPATSTENLNRTKHLP